MVSWHAQTSENRHECRVAVELAGTFDASAHKLDTASKIFIFECPRLIFHIVRGKQHAAVFALPPSDNY